MGGFAATTRARLRRRMDLALASGPALKAVELLAPERTRRARMVGAPHHWSAHRDFQIDFLQGHAGLQPQHRLLDLGCGNLRAGVPLVAYLDPGNYCGIEARPEVLDDGRRRLRDAGLDRRRPELVALPADGFSQLCFDAAFDRAWAFAVLIHFRDDVLDAALGMIGRYLAEDGVFYANVNSAPAAEREWQGFPVVFREVGFYREAAARHGLAAEPIGTLAGLGYPAHMSGHSQLMLRFTH